MHSVRTEAFSPSEAARISRMAARWLPLNSSAVA